MENIKCTGNQVSRTLLCAARTLRANEIHIMALPIDIWW